MKFALNDGENIYWKEISNEHEMENFQKFIEILEYSDDRANLRGINHIAKNKLMEIIVFVRYGSMNGVHEFLFTDSNEYMQACNELADWEEAFA